MQSFEVSGIGVCAVRCVVCAVGVCARSVRAGLQWRLRFQWLLPWRQRRTFCVFVCSGKRSSALCFPVFGKRLPWAYRRWCFFVFVFFYNLCVPRLCGSGNRRIVRCGCAIRAPKFIPYEVRAAVVLCVDGKIGKRDLISTTISLSGLRSHSDATGRISVSA